MKRFVKMTSIVFIFIMMLFIGNVRAEENQEIYLSDIDYTSDSRSGWGSLLKDKTSNNSKISVKIEGAYYTFEKGMWAHATSTLIYDISEISNTYRYFTAYLGLNQTAASSSNGVIFKIYTSNDKKNWNLVHDTGVVKPGANATLVQIDITNAHYLKLVADSNGSNGNDHSVYADAKLVKNIENDNVIDLGNGNVIKSLEQYDKMLKEQYTNATLDNKDYELVLLQREFIKNVGQYALKRFVEESDAHKETLNWLFNNVDNLRLYIGGGAPDGGSYYNSLSVLSNLYNTYKADLNNTTLLNNKWYPSLTYGDLYKKMMVTLSLTHSTTVALWMQSSPDNISNPVTRYQIYKDLHLKSKSLSVGETGGFKAWEGMDFTPLFEALHVEEMRFVLNNIIDDPEIVWLNEFTQSYIDAEQNNKARYLTPHPYMRYVWPNYGDQRFHDPSQKDYWDSRYMGIFSKYGVKYEPGLYKVWMNLNRSEFESGAVCGGISKTGSNIRAVHGIPSSVISQPGHAALIYYNKTADGRGYWNIDNDVSGWAQSGRTERLNLRMPLGWGNEEYIDFNKDWLGMATYVLLAQGALNDFDNYIKSREVLILADVYKDDTIKLTEIYRKSLEYTPINIDAWYGLIKTYKTEKRSAEDFYNLGNEILTNLKDYPLPMYHLTREISEQLKSPVYSFVFTLNQTKVLKEASVKNNNEHLQAGAIRQEASYLLGIYDSNLATFSFNGENANKIILSSKYDGTGIRWDYSLDGKQTWKEVYFTADEEHKLLLTDAEVNSITSGNDIYIHIVGVDYDDDNLYKIDITEQSIPSVLYANDLENRIIGVNNNIEWRISGDTNWTSYATASPDLTGDRIVEIRVAANGTKLTSDSVTYTFTKNSDDLTRRYVPVSRLSIVGVSSEATGQKRYATNAIDGNYNTNWHSDWNGNDTQRYIIIKVDKPIYLSEIEYVPGGGGNGKIKNGTIYGSNDGKNWEEIKKVSNLTYNNGGVNDYDHGFKNTKNFKIESDKRFQYIKIVADTTTNGRNFFVASMFNIYEDATKLPKNPTAEISYSTTTSTNDEVIVKLINPSTKITITNNNGFDSYRFTENGTFTFEFVSDDGLKGTATATVNWIDKDLPTADVEYNIDSDNKLKILLDSISEDVYLLDKNDNKISYIEVKDKKVSSIHYLDSNGEIIKTIAVDENGKIQKVIYKNTTGNVGIVDTYVTTLENGVIVKEEWFDSSKNNIIAGNSYVDDFGNSVSVSQVQLDSLKCLQQPISSPLEYTFDGSGDYEFKFQDKASNIAYKSIKVDYIDNKTTIIASDITYNITKLTNKDVIATINPYIIDTTNKEAVMLNNQGKTYTFKENGKFTFEYKDPTDTENWEVKSHTAEVDWIDKTLPTASINYSTKEETDKVIVTLVNESEPIKIINNNQSREYMFTENGSFEFEIEDEAGNTNKVVATVNWIKRQDDVWEEPDTPKPSEPVTPEQPGDIVIIPDNQFGNANNQVDNSDNQDNKTDTDIEDKKPTDNDNKKPTVSENKPNKENSNKTDNEKVTTEINEKKSNSWLKIVIVVTSIIIVSILGLVIKHRYDNR